VDGVGGGGGSPNWGGMNSSGMWSSLYNPPNTYDTSQQPGSGYSNLQTWVCASGAVYNYVNMGGGAIQNPCLSNVGISGIGGPGPIGAVTLPADFLADLQAAIPVARNYAKAALNVLNTDQLSPGSAEYYRFNLWFGDPSEDLRREKVRGIYYSIWELLWNPNTIWHFGYNPDEDEPWGSSFGTMAQTNWKTTFTHGWKLRQGQPPPSSQAGIMIHELAHIADWFVGDQGPRKIYKEWDNYIQYRLWAMKNATPTGTSLDPLGFNIRDKINEADCYKYYAENVTGSG